MVAFNFNAQQYDPSFSGGGEQLPPGKQYKVVIVDSGKDNTKDNTGGFLFVNCAVIEGPLQGRKQMIRFNLHHTNPKTVEIANGQLSALCHAVGVFQMVDTAQLHDKPFLIDVDWQKNQEPNAAAGRPGGGYTEVKAIYDLAGNKPGKGGGAAANAQSQYQGGGNPNPPPAGVHAQGGWDNGGGQGGGQQQGQGQGGGYQQQGGPPPQQQQQGGGWGGPPPQQQQQNNGPQPGDFQQQNGGQQQQQNGGGWGQQGGGAPNGWGNT